MSGSRFVSGPGEVTLSQCVYCEYLREVGCAAFPGGIPEAILRNEHDHRAPYPGDGGVRFTPRNDVPR